MHCAGDLFLFIANIFLCTAKFYVWAEKYCALISCVCVLKKKCTERLYICALRRIFCALK